MMPASITERALREFAEAFERNYNLSGLNAEGKHWSAHWRKHEIPRWTEVANLALSSKPRRILDVGCEFATYAWFLRDILRLEVRGADHPAALPRLGSYWQANGFEVRPWDLTAGTCPYAEPFDAVIASEVIEHVPLPASETLARLATALRPGGTLVFSTPNIHRLSNILHLLEGRNILPQIPKSGTIPIWMHAREFTVNEIRAAIPEAGLESGRVFTSSCWDRPGSSGERSLARRALKALWHPFSRLFPRYRSCIMGTALKSEGTRGR